MLASRRLPRRMVLAQPGINDGFRFMHLVVSSTCATGALVVGVVVLPPPSASSGYDIISRPRFFPDLIRSSVVGGGSTVL